MIFIKQMERGDIPSAVALERECFSQPWSTESFESAFEAGNTYFFAAFSDDTLAGYAGMQVFPPDAAVTNIAVGFAFRRRGIGRALLTEMISFCRRVHVTSLTLEVRASNDPAVFLYEGMNFERLGLRRNFYSAPVEDAVIMRLNISQ